MLINQKVFSFLHDALVNYISKLSISLTNAVQNYPIKILIDFDIKLD